MTAAVTTSGGEAVTVVENGHFHTFLNGKEIYEDGGVEIISINELRAMFKVPSQSRDKDYTVSIVSNPSKQRLEIQCGCPKGVTDGVENSPCKHKEAVRALIFDRSDDFKELNQ